MAAKEGVSQLQTTPHESHIEQVISIQEQQVATEQTSNLHVSTNAPAKVETSRKERGLLSKKSLERVSPQRPGDEVTINFINQLLYRKCILW